MKISSLEKIVLGLTAAFLLVTAGYFIGVRTTAEPFRVDVEHYQTQERVPAQTSSAASPAAQGPVNINTATVEVLERLPGIGKKRAADIVADREANGPFSIPEDITRVSGIGEGTLAGLIDMITVGE